MQIRNAIRGAATLHVSSHSFRTTYIASLYAHLTEQGQCEQRHLTHRGSEWFWPIFKIVLSLPVFRVKLALLLILSLVTVWVTHFRASALRNWGFNAMRFCALHLPYFCLRTYHPFVFVYLIFGSAFPKLDVKKPNFLYRLFPYWNRQSNPHNFRSSNTTHRIARWKIAWSFRRIWSTACLQRTSSCWTQILMCWRRKRRTFYVHQRRVLIFAFERPVVRDKTKKRRNRTGWM